MIIIASTPFLKSISSTKTPSSSLMAKGIEGLYNHDSEANLVEIAAPEPEHFTGL